MLLAAVGGILLWAFAPGAAQRRAPISSEVATTGERGAVADLTAEPPSGARGPRELEPQSLRLRLESALPAIPSPSDADADPVHVRVSGSGADGFPREARFDRSLPGTIELDTASFDGPLTVTAWNPFFVLDPPRTLVPPHPDEVLLSLEPRGVLTVELVELPEGAAFCELLVIAEDSEDLGDARDDGRWQTVEEPGRWTFEHLEPGTYTVSARPVRVEPGTYPIERPPLHYSVDVDLALGEETVVVLPDHDRQLVRLTGELLREGVPVVNAELGFHVLHGGFGAMVRTGEDGRFRTELLGSGSVRCKLYSVDDAVSHFRTVWMLDVPSVAAHDVELGVPGAAVEGRVVDPSGEVVSGMRVHICPLPLDDMSPTRDGWAAAITDAEGRYLLEGLRPGRYLVNLRPRYPVDREPGQAIAYDSVTVEVETGSVTAPDLVVREAIGVHCTVSVREDTPAGCSVSQVMIFLRPVDSEDGKWIWVGWTDAEGRFEGQSVGPGSYDLHATGLRLASPDGLRVELPADAEWMDVPLVPAGRFRVRWIDSTGRARRFRLGILDGEGNALPLPGPNTEHRSEQRSRWLAPGRYTLRVQGWSGPSREKVVELGAGELEVRIVEGE